MTASVLAAVHSVLQDEPWPASVSALCDRMAERGRPAAPLQVMAALERLAAHGLADRLDLGPGRPALWTVPDAVSA